ncbi:MAG TPA: hypothetical protein VJN18_35610 [Polyangiaceae bacterium]|nr:hypothetical protein [Polyangiaceae bacterium]
MADLTPERLAELAELLENATPGPWASCHKPPASFDDHGMRSVALTGASDQHMVWIPRDRVAQLKGRAWVNAALIAEAINALPALLASARRLQRLESALEFLDESYAASPSKTSAQMRRYPSDPERNCVMTVADIFAAATELGWKGDPTT